MKDRSVISKIQQDWVKYGETYEILSKRYKVSNHTVSGAIQLYLKKLKNEA